MTSLSLTPEGTPRFGRVLTAMATPFADDYSLDLDGARRLAVHLADNGSDGLVVCGTTGESPTLTHDETLALLRTVVDAVGDRVSVIAGTGKNDTAGTVALTEEVSALGVDGVLVVTPYYNRPSQRGLVRHFSAAAAATDLPVLLYNIPGRTGREIEPATVLQLAAEVENIVGVKDAVGDLVKTATVLSRAPDDFLVYSGDDAATLPMLAVGGCGVISVAAHVVGPDFAKMVAAFETDPAEARRIHIRILPLLETLMTTDPSPGPLKAALRLLALPGGPVRPPLVDCDDVAVDEVHRALVSAGVLA